MNVQKIKSGRVTGIDVATFVGARGQLFYDEDTGMLWLSDGVNPGGNRARLPIATASSLGAIKVGSSLSIDDTGILNTDLSTVTQDIIPSQDSTFSLGSPDFKWKELFVSDGSVHIGNLHLSNDNGGLVVANSLLEIPVDPDPQSGLRIVKDADDYVSISIQNTNTGRKASSDILLYQNADTNNYYANFGIANSNYQYTGFEIIEPDDTYLIGSGGNIKIGTTMPTHDIVFFTGGTDSTTREIARFKDGSGLLLNGSLIFNNGTSFSGSYNELTDKPILGFGSLTYSYNNLTDKPITPPRYTFMESNRWVVTHNMNTRSFVAQLTDSHGNTFFAGITIVDSNRFIVNLTEATGGMVDVIFNTAG
jgi:hypothetical protein